MQDRKPIRLGLAEAAVVHCVGMFQTLKQTASATCKILKQNYNDSDSMLSTLDVVPGQNGLKSWCLPPRNSAPPQLIPPAPWPALCQRAIHADSVLLCRFIPHL